MLNKLNLNDIRDNFALFDDWEARFQYIIDLGKSLPNLEDSYKIDLYKVEGCTSQVWLVPGIDEGIFYFRADSDAFIVRGLIAILMAAYNGQPVAEISTIDIDGAFEEMGLNDNLSPNRRSGFFSMVEKIRALTSSVPHQGA